MKKVRITLTPKDLADLEELQKKSYYDDLIRNMAEQLQADIQRDYFSSIYGGLIPPAEPKPDYEPAPPNLEIDYTRVTIDVKPKKD